MKVALLLPAIVGCSLALDTDELRFADNDTSPADVSGVDDGQGLATDTPLGVDDGSPTAGETDAQKPPDDLGQPISDTAQPTADMAQPSLDTWQPADTGPQDPDTSPNAAIRLGTDASGCTGAYKIKAGVPLVTPDCAQACSNGAAGWPVPLQAIGPGAATAAWTVEATQGITAAPASGSGETFKPSLTFGKDNCGSTDAVPNFTLLVTAKFGGATVKTSYTFSPTLNSQCPAVTCD